MQDHPQTPRKEEHGTQFIARGLDENTFDVLLGAGVAEGDATARGPRVPTGVTHPVVSRRWVSSVEERDDRVVRQAIGEAKRQLLELRRLAPLVGDKEQRTPPWEESLVE